MIYIVINNDMHIHILAMCISKCMTYLLSFRYGMKIFMACDAESHYMCNAMVYLGKGTLEVPRTSTMGEVVVTKLVEPFFVGGRTVTTDNFFTTLPLTLSLASHGMYLCGTIRIKPYIPKELYNRKLQVKESIAVFNHEHNLTLQCQQVSDKKKVLILSSCHHNPSVIEKNKTELQMFYNATKGGVDTFDQLKIACRFLVPLIHTLVIEGQNHIFFHFFPIFLL